MDYNTEIAQLPPRARRTIEWYIKNTSRETYGEDGALWVPVRIIEDRDGVYSLRNNGTVLSYKRLYCSSLGMNSIAVQFKNVGDTLMPHFSAKDIAYFTLTKLADVEKDEIIMVVNAQYDTVSFYFISECEATELGGKGEIDIRILQALPHTNQEISIYKLVDFENV